VNFRAENHGREYPGGDPSAGSIVPLITAVVFIFVILSTSGLMTDAVVREKENRTMEIVLTSVSPGQMMTGKILGIGATALTQLVVWVLCLVGAVWLAANVLDVEWVQNVTPVWTDLLKLAAIAAPTFLLIAAVMATIGSTIAEPQEAQQLGGLLFLLLFSPIYLIIPIMQNPNGGLALALSLVPVTSVLANAMRMISYNVPVAQVAAASGIGFLAAGVMIWVAGKALRVGMLRYGRRVRLREVLRLGTQ
jgi:ABC-2 type transport system permease protein